jgi:hypothetical protein
MLAVALFLMAQNGKESKCPSFLVNEQTKYDISIHWNTTEQ